MSPPAFALVHSPVQSSKIFIYVRHIIYCLVMLLLTVCLCWQLHAMDVLHDEGYHLSSAICSLVPPTGPVLCRDEMEEWSAAEANLFEEALDKYGKDFSEIRQDYVRNCVRILDLTFDFFSSCVLHSSCINMFLCYESYRMVWTLTWCFHITILYICSVV